LREKSKFQKGKIIVKGGPGGEVVQAGKQIKRVRGGRFGGSNFWVGDIEGHADQLKKREKN